ncbi:MAG TPA: N-acetylmuramic acid 6-phosphate etherase [Phycisphaerae bacterium]|nr:N-acetylmuramic acid 6-phosphate etherase [Phycisphaerae bacterium]
MKPNASLKRRKRRLIRSRGHLLTEQHNRRSAALDAMPLDRAFDVMNGEDETIPTAVARAKPAILRAIRAVSSAWKKGGRLVYIGAGTSGRLGVLDAAECPPTFRSDPKMVRGIISGGKKALWRSVEGAEDDARAAAKAVREIAVNKYDVVMGIATGGTTPYVHSALAEAKRRRATTIFFACVPRSQVRIACDIDIRVLTGPEILSGSTRLKAGTATKLVLNTITTLGMVGIGKTYGNLMVDLNSYACRKLTERATRVVAAATGHSRPTALRLLHNARGSAKCAIVMHHLGLPRAKAEALLKHCHGRVRDALHDRLRQKNSRRQ